MDARRVVIRGRVQGVGFRWFVVRNARALGVGGSVKNRPDGSVEAILKADRPGAVEALIERMREGPSAARVEEIDVEALAGAEENGHEMRVIR